jgi:curved DNA-binding protein CbpA
LLLFDDVKKSHYETLGVAKTAADGEIKRAYFNLVRKYQPDRFPEEFKEIRSAYETLMDGAKRAEYDAIGDLPPAVEPLFHAAQRYYRLGRQDKAAELYQAMLKSHPELDNIREQYAVSLFAANKTGKVVEVWEELCRRQPDNPRYARELARSYLDRGWSRKAMAEARRSVALDRSSITGWSLLVNCAVENIRSSNDIWGELEALADEALEAVKDVRTGEWGKIYIHGHAFLAAGIKKVEAARGHLREIVRLTRECGREGRDEGRSALKEILFFVPANSLAEHYPELEELANLLPDLPRSVREQLDIARLGFEIAGLEQKKFPGIFIDLFRLLNSDMEEEEDKLEVVAIEYHLLDDKKNFEPFVRRLKAEFPEIYALHASFFDDYLRSRDPEKMLSQRARRYKKLKRYISFDDEEQESEPSGTVRRSQPKVGRNDPCPCGSGKKYKHCCGAAV